MADSWGYKDKAKTWKSEIRKKFPRCKVSVTIKHFDNICIALLSGDFQMYADNFTGNRKGYKQLNPFSFISGKDKSLSDEMNEFWSYVDKVGRKILGNQTNPDHNPMIDYYSVNYYLNYEIGKWNQPYVCTNETKSAKINKIANRIAEELVLADADYIYDPDHKKHPGGGYHKTEKGWSKKEEKKEKSTSSPKVKMTDEQKKLDEEANNGDYFDKLSVSENPNTHPKTLDKLFNDNKNDEVFTVAVAQNPNTHPKTLDKLSNDEYESVRYFVAEHQNTSVKTLDKLSNDENYEVRCEVAKNKNTHPKTLDKLSNDEDWRVRNVVAQNRNTSGEVLDKLSNDKNDEVRKNVAGNPKTPIETLEKISKTDKSNGGIARFNLYNRPKEVGQRNWKNNGFDTSKLSPELRGKIEYWDAEDIAKFVAWLKEHKN